MLYEHENYRSFLKASLVEKSKANGGYSMRAFAQKLGVSSSFLSEVMNGKKELSLEAAFRVAMKLDLTDTETQYFCLLIQLGNEKDAELRERLEKRLQQLNPSRKSFDLSVDNFKVISDWYHFGILELTHLPDFKLDASYISSRLGIGKMEAELAIERLQRLGLIQFDAAAGRYRKAHNHVFTQSAAPNAALKIFHKQLLQKALAAVDSQMPTQRMSASDVVAIDSKYFPEVERLSLEFSEALFRISEKSRTKDKVYALCTHFIELTVPDEVKLQ